MSLVLSGNEITDPTRAAAIAWAFNQQGGSTDGRSFYKVTNLVFNGGFELNATGYAPSAGVTIAKTAAQALFGNASGLFTRTAVGEVRLLQGATISGTTAGRTYTFSVYVFGDASSAGNTCRLRINESGGASGSTQIIESAPVAIVNGVWTRLTATATVVQADRTSVDARLVWDNGAVASFVYVDGWQVEESSVANSFVDTQGNIASAVQSDGTKNGFALWEAGTNLFRRGQCDAVTDWNTASTGVVTRTVDATMPAPFSPQSMKFVTDGTGSAQGALADTATGLAGAAGTSCVGSMYFKGVAGLSYNIRLRVNYTDATQDLSNNLFFNATGSWQLITTVPIVSAVAKTVDRLRVEVDINGTRAETFWCAHPMAQLGPSIVSPYVATSGGATATRNATRVQAPSALLNATQGWWAISFTPPWSAVAAPANQNNLRLLYWQGSDSNNRFDLAYTTTSSVFTFNRSVGGSAVGANSAVQAFASGATIVVVGKWDSLTCSVSAAGVNFIQSGTQAGIPAVTQTIFDIGSFNGGSHWLDANVRWVACGVGTLSNADAATLSALGATAPVFSTLPLGAKTTMIWPAVSGTAADEQEIYWGADSGLGTGTNVGTPAVKITGNQTGVGSESSGQRATSLIGTETPHSVDVSEIAFSWLTGRESGSGSESVIKTEPVEFPTSGAGGLLKPGEGRIEHPEVGSVEEMIGR